MREEVVPGPNPSRITSNPENILYETWKNSEAWERPAIEQKLLSHLRRHASKVCWMVLHSYQPHLIDEVAQDALMDIQNFRGESAFATWFHGRALNRFRNERASQMRRKEVSLESLPTGALITLASKDSSLELKAIIDEMLQGLSEYERTLVELKVYGGLTDAEIGLRLGFSREWIQITWSKLRKSLRDAYNGKAT